MRMELPAEINSKMQLWRAGLERLPTEYIEWHQKLAEEALFARGIEHNLIIYKLFMAPDGWCDGMRVLHAVVETRTGKLIKIRWHDGNQDFMKDVGAGWAAMMTTDWN